MTATTAKESIVADLESRESEIQTLIENAASSGANTASFRAELKTVQAQLKTARADVDTEQSEARQADARVTIANAEAAANVTLNDITTGAEPFARLLVDGVPVPDFTDAPAVFASAANLAHARQRVSAAEKAFVTATNEVNDLSAKATEKRARHAELSQQRITGEAGDGSAAEMYALAEDTKTIDLLVITAKAKADALLPELHATRNAFKTTESQDAKIIHGLNAQHLANHATALETAYLACLRAARDEGAMGGVTLGSLYRTSPELRGFVNNSLLR